MLGIQFTGILVYRTNAKILRNTTTEIPDTYTNFLLTHDMIYLFEGMTIYKIYSMKNIEVNYHTDKKY